MPTSDTRLLFVATATQGDALASRREAQLWRACAQLCESFRLQRGGAPDLGAELKNVIGEFKPDIVVITDPALADDAPAMKDSGARVAAALLRDDAAWRERIRSAATGIDSVWTWAGDTPVEHRSIVTLSEPIPSVTELRRGASSDRKIGLLLEGNAGRDELEALAKFGEAVGRLAEPWAVVVPSSSFYEYTRLAPHAIALNGASIEDVIAAAPICAHTDRSRSVPALEALARAAGKRVVRVDGGAPEHAIRELAAAGEKEGTRVTPDATDVVKLLAEALGVEAPADPAIAGSRLSRNLGIKVEIAVARYNPWLRLLVVEADITGAVRREDIGGRIESSASGELINAWVARLPESAGAPLRIRAIATLRGEIEPKDVRIVVSAWGWPVAEIALPEPMPEQRAGLIALNLRDAGHAVVEYWGEPGDAKVQLGRKMLESEPARRANSTPSYFRIEGKYPFDRDSLTTFSAAGTGQKFTNFRNLAFAVLPSSARVQAMRNRHEGEAAWIVGNGPSAQPDDLDLLAGRITFGFNRFYLAHEQTRLRPTYTISGDRQMIDDFGDEIVSRSSGDVFLAHHEPPAISGDYCWLRQVGIFPSLFSRDPSLFVSPGGSSLYVALQLGFYMGIRKFYLYGTDFQFRFDANPDSDDDFRAARGEGNHFISNYRGGRDWCPPAIENILPSFLAAKLLIESEDGFIRNATRGGVLEVFDRLAFDDALSES